MEKENSSSILVTGVPVERGRPVHIEHDDDIACCDFDTKSGQVLRLHTPQDSFRRVHELMHARHTDMKRGKRQYKGIVDTVWNNVEDCRIHTKYWPWRIGDTPADIKRDAVAFLADEMATMEKGLVEDPTRRGSWPDFATRLRQCAVKSGFNSYVSLDTAGFFSDLQVNLAREVLRLVHKNKEGQAARLLQSVFFPPPPFSANGNGAAKGKGTGIKNPAINGGIKQPVMEIIELPHTEVIPQAARGYRRATSGSRLHRPSLRRPILPQRLFVRKTPREPNGTILIDASGSMGDWDQVRSWCEKAPFGTIAYYAGGTKDGWLYVYARNGRRAQEIVEPDYKGNTVDGPAMDWLLTQAKPRLMITDRGFCGATDSFAQKVRLEQLELAGEIKVVDYAHDDE